MFVIMPPAFRKPYAAAIHSLFDVNAFDLPVAGHSRGRAGTSARAGTEGAHADARRRRPVARLAESRRQAGRAASDRAASDDRAALPCGRADDWVEARDRSDRRAEQQHGVLPRRSEDDTHFDDAGRVSCLAKEAAAVWLQAVDVHG